jgi:hypothetical protein
MGHFIFEAEQLQDFAAGLVVDGRTSTSVNVLGQSQVPLRRQGWKEVEPLEDEPDLAAANIGPRRVAQLGQVFAVNDDATFGWAEQAAKDVEQGRFPAARRSHDRDKLAWIDGQIDPPQGVHIDFANAVGHGQVFSQKYMAHKFASIFLRQFRGEEIHVVTQLSLTGPVRGHQ